MPLNVFFHAQPSPTRASTSSCHHHNDITATSCYWAVSYGAMTPVRRDRHDDATAAPSGAKGSASVETAGAASATPTHRSSLGKGRILQPNVMQMIGFVQRMGQLVLGHGAVNAWSGRPVHPHPTTSTSSCPGRPGGEHSHPPRVPQQQRWGLWQLRARPDTPLYMLRSCGGCAPCQWRCERWTRLGVGARW